MKKVVFIGTGFHPIPSMTGAAVETWIDKVAKHLSAYEPYIISPYSSPHDPPLPLFEIVNGVTYYRIKMGRLYTRLFKKITRLDPYSYDKRVADITAKVNPDIVHIHNRYKIFSKLTAPLKKDIKKILQIHNGDPSGLSTKVDAFTGCCNFTLNRCSHLLNPRPDKLGILYNGVDIDKFQPWWKKMDTKNRIRQQYSINSEMTILTVCRVSPEKGLEYLIEAFKMVLKIYPSSKLIIVGEIRKGTRRDCDREAYGRKITKMIEGLEKNIILTDVISPEKVHRYYLLGDIFILMSKNENFPFVILEAMASGLPVIASNVGGISEVVKNGINGLLIDNPKNIDLIYTKLLWLLDNKNVQIEMGEKGREDVEINFTWQKIAKDTENFYDDLYRQPQQ